MDIPDNVSAPHRGRSAEFFIAAQLMSTGIVAVPLLQTPSYDLLLDLGGRIWKIQVKQAQFIPQRIRPQGLGDRACWRVDLTANKPKGHTHQYSARSFDVLAVLCTPALTYYLPVTALTGQEGRLVRHVLLKVVDEALSRKDAQAAAERWARYRGSVSPALRELVVAGNTTATDTADAPVVGA